MAKLKINEKPCRIKLEFDFQPDKTLQLKYLAFEYDNNGPKQKYDHTKIRVMDRPKKFMSKVQKHVKNLMTFNLDDYHMDSWHVFGAYVGKVQVEYRRKDLYYYV